MKKLLALLFALILPLAVHARALMVAEAPTGETLTLTSEKWECPSSPEGAERAWDARMVIYHDPRDGEKAQGCYVIDDQSDPHAVVIIFKHGSLAGAPIYLPTRIFKPEI